MTDAERESLDRLMAEKDMGWTRSTENHPWQTVTGRVVAPIAWSPTTDPRAASAVMARLTEERKDPADRTRGWDVSIYHRYREPWHVTLEGDSQGDFYQADAPTWPEALCLAAKKAWEEKV